MNSRQERSEFAGSAPVMRALAFVLLIFVAYGSVAEVTHKHGGFVIASISAEAPASGGAFDTAGDTGPISHTSSTGECLICQLHHDLFANEFTHHINTAPQMAHMAYSLKAAPAYHSLAEMPQRGRAPPLTFLS